MKIRLHGTKEEIAVALERIEKLFDVVSVSKHYTDRGKSRLFRVYVDVRM